MKHLYSNDLPEAKEWIIKIPKVLPCPCCGEDRDLMYDKRKARIVGLKVGVLSCMGRGVECFTCGLTMSKTMPDRLPKELKMEHSKEHTLSQWTLNKAARAWNRRALPRKKKEE